MTEIPRATVRLQLHKDFDFARAAAQVPYFARLGISHLYLSPIHTARPGSPHSYDVVDYGRINPELGGEAGFRQLVTVVRAHRMGIIVDIVPNHMAVGGHHNKAWLDLLEWGKQSRYAEFFDIDWDVADPALHQRVLGPFLGKPYGEALAEGELTLAFDPERGRFHTAYYDHHFPVAARDYAPLLRGSDVLEAYVAQFRAISYHHGKNRGAFDILCQRLAQDCAANSAVAQAIDERLQAFDAGSPEGRRRLHRLLEHQHYRLAWWQTAADEINWRRFFDIIELAGLRVQDRAAFNIVHEKTFQLYREGLIDGVRVDHVDGIADPGAYCQRLRRELNRLKRERPADAPQGGPYIYVEKILAPDEQLNPAWGVDGDTGYSFMNDVGALLHDSRGEEAISQAWVEFAGRPGDFERVEKRARRRTIETILAADFHSCVKALHTIARSRPETRDYTFLAIRRLLADILTEFPVYRTYVDSRGRSAADAAIMERTLAAVRERCVSTERPILEAIDRWLGAEAPYTVKPASARRARLKAIARFQQLSSPVAAKSVEDTAFYRYGRLLSRNEVGSLPSQFSLSVTDFHAEYRRRRQRHPLSLLGTATHDHKRGEDIRARLAVLSEFPQSWLEQVSHWQQLNQPLRSRQSLKNSDDKPAPDAADEYMLYQMLVGSWAPDDTGTDLPTLCERLVLWQEKAVREAKRNSSWTAPNLTYEKACRDFTEKLLDPTQSSAFLEQLDTFVRRIAPAGGVNSLVQTLIKLTAPGVADFYQGCELWDFSFVDPDNRRPVDYQHRRQLLAEDRSSTDVPFLEALNHWRDGAVKQRLIATVLHYRQAHPRLFTQGRYLPLSVQGPRADHVIAFAREWQGALAITACVRNVSEWVTDKLAIDAGFWPDEYAQDTRVMLPKSWKRRRLVNLLTGEEIVHTQLPASWLFGRAGVALLTVG